MSDPAVTVEGKLVAAGIAAVILSLVNFKILNVIDTSWIGSFVSFGVAVALFVKTFPELRGCGNANITALAIACITIFTIRKADLVASFVYRKLRERNVFGDCLKTSRASDNRNIGGRSAEENDINALFQSVAQGKRGSVLYIAMQSSLRRVRSSSAEDEEAGGGAGGSSFSLACYICFWVSCSLFLCMYAIFSLVTGILAIIMLWPTEERVLCKSRSEWISRVNVTLLCFGFSIFAVISLLTGAFLICGVTQFMGRNGESSYGKFKNVVLSVLAVTACAIISVSVLGGIVIILLWRDKDVRETMDFFLLSTYVLESVLF